MTDFILGAILLLRQKNSEWVNENTYDVLFTILDHFSSNFCNFWHQSKVSCFMWGESTKKVCHLKKMLGIKLKGGIFVKEGAIF